MSKPRSASRHQDAEIIEALGGASKVAELLGLERAGGPQRVHNWMARGIPPKEKLKRPDLFLTHLTAPPAANDPAPQAQQAAG